MTVLPNALDAIPLVLNASDRGLRFPLPNTNQRVYNLGTQYIERWQGGAWVQDIPFGSLTGGQTFTGGTVPNPTTFASTSVFGAGIQIAGPLFGSSGTIDLQTNSARQNRTTSVNLLGPASDSSQDVSLINGGNGTFQVNVQGSTVGLQVNTNESFFYMPVAIVGNNSSLTVYGSTFIINAARQNLPALVSAYGGNSAGVIDVQSGNDGSGNFVTVNGSNVIVFKVDQAGNVTMTGSATVAGTLGVTGLGTFTAGVTLGALSTGVTATLGDSSTNLATTAFVAAAVSAGGGGAGNPFLINSGRSAVSAVLNLAGAATASDITFTNGNNGNLVIATSTATPVTMMTLNATTGTFLNFGIGLQHSYANSGATGIYIDINQGRVQTTNNVAIRFKGASADGILAYSTTTNTLGWITSAGTVFTVDVNGNLTAGNASTGASSFLGPVTGVTATVGDNTTKFATTAYVTAAIAAAGSGTAANPLLVNSARSAGSATLTLQATSSGSDVSFVNNGSGQLTLTSGANNVLILPTNAGGTLNYGLGVNHSYTAITGSQIYWDLNLARAQTTTGVAIRFKGASGAADGIISVDAATAQYKYITTNGTVFSVDVSGNAVFTGTGAFSGAVTGVTATFADSTTKFATTAFVQAAVSAVSGGGISNPLIVNSARGSSTASLVLQGSSSANDATWNNDGTTASLLLGSAGTLFSVANGAGSYLQYGYAVDRPYSGTNWTQWNKSRLITTGTYYLEVLGASSSQDTYLQFNAGTGTFSMATGGNSGSPQWAMDSNGNITTTGNLNTSGPINMNIASGNVYQVLNAARTTGGTQLQFLASSSANDIQFVTQNNGTAYFASNTSPIFSMKANGISVSTGATYQVNLTQVVSARQTGWAAATGTATRTSFATGSVTLPNLAQAVKALIDDLITHGLIGT